ncbi:hypothetical protein [Cylindrospermopsis raciborskii]|uniref:hypothetical protein n=1 Tax=Cylindrospermopsis raciborskii TaxID=77022 RepID=UPI0022C44356|nr:hypothetical protein [Cylindrospermopsis raciborskii]MCZ2207849.1 hypothetical protein [Cylindrospermopsis raciborskii PAMP2011]
MTKVFERRSPAKNPSPYYTSSRAGATPNLALCLFYSQSFSDDHNQKNHSPAIAPNTAKI